MPFHVLVLQRFAFTLRGLVKRMARLADNARYGMRQQRMAALRWLAAMATTLGGECVSVCSLFCQLHISGGKYWAIILFHFGMRQHCGSLINLNYFEALWHVPALWFCGGHTVGVW